jgi:hypothetical protein
MGLNPDNLLVKMEQPQMSQPMPQEAAMPQQMSPEAGMPVSEDDILAQLQSMGGTPMLGAQDGGLL